MESAHAIRDDEESSRTGGFEDDDETVGTDSNLSCKGCGGYRARCVSRLRPSDESPVTAVSGQMSSFQRGFRYHSMSL